MPPSLMMINLSRNDWQLIFTYIKKPSSFSWEKMVYLYPQWITKVKLQNQILSWQWKKNNDLFYLSFKNGKIQWKTGIFPHMNFFFSLVIWNESTPGLASVLLFAIFSLSFYQIRKIYHYFIFCLAKGQFDPVWHSVCGSEGYWPQDWITIDAEVILISTKCAFHLFLPRQIHRIISCWSFHPKSVVLREKLIAFMPFSTQDQENDFCLREIFH